jgi:hypothetical protein
MYYTRYQTATQLVIGPVIRATNGYSPLTGLTSNSIGFFYWVGTGPTTGAYATAGSSGITEVASGYYRTWISSDMTNALGPGVICYETSGSSGLPMVDHYIVLAQHTFDALIKGTGTDVLQVDITQIAGVTAGITAGGILHSVQSYIGSTGASMASGIMTTSYHAFNALVLSVGASGTTVNSTTPWHQTSAQGFLANVTLLNSATLSTRTGDNIEAAFYNANATATKIYNSLTTMTSASLSTFSTALQVDVGRFAGASFSTRSGDNIEAALYNAGATATKIYNSLTTMTSASLSTFSTALQVDVGRFAGASFSTRSGDNIEAALYNAGATATKIYNNLSSASTAGLSTFTTALTVLANMVQMASQALTTWGGANFATFFDNAAASPGKTVGSLSTISTAGISTLSTADLNNVSTFSVDNVYDVWTHANLMKLIQSHLLGDSSFIGSGLTLYDHAGTTFVSFEITTAERTRTT